ncbi:MAG: hypothetical protein ACKO7D_06585 [Bacteroidota bacterium]
MNFIFDLLIGFLFAIFSLWFIGKTPYFRRSGFSIQSLQFAFVLKVLVGFLLFLLYSFHYTVRAEADTFRYFDDSAILYESLGNRPLDFFQMMTGIGIESDYFDAHYFSKMNNWYRSYENGLINDNRLVIRINAFLRIFSFGSYHFHSVILNLFAFIGALELAKLFLYISNSKWKSFVAAFLIPSFVFWSSGVLKETLLVGFFGICIYRAFLIWNQKFTRKSLFLFIVSLFFLFIIKVYVLLAFLPVLLWWSLKKFIPDWRFSLFFTGAIFIGVLFLVPHLFQHVNPLHILVQKQHDFINLAEAFNAKSKIDLPYLQESYFSILEAAPIGFVNTLLRPFPSDINSILVVLPFLENLLLIILAIMAVLVGQRSNQIQFEFNLAVLLFICGLFIIIGVSTPIIGAIVRYKIPGLPFLFVGILLYFNEKKLPNIVKKNRYITWIHSRL